MNLTIFFGWTVSLNPLVLCFEALSPLFLHCCSERKDLEVKVKADFLTVCDYEEV